MQHDIGAHALVADGRTAALIDPEGDISWLCWPRIDSEPCLRSLIDEGSSSFSVRPATADARVLRRAYHDGTLVLRTTWAAGRARVHIDDALRWEWGPQLVRLLHAEGDAEVEVHAAFAGPHHPLLRIAGQPVRTAARTTRFTLRDGDRCAVTLGGDDAGPVSLEQTIACWRTGTASASRIECDVAAVDSRDCRAALLVSACVLLGLCRRGGGIVAAPTTSLPQWPGGSRNWDYRYCWLRDAALAAIALLRLGMERPAWQLATFIGEAALGSPCTLVRVDGTPAPDETVRADLGGYRGARPVRFGNAASSQRQLDVPGEVVQLATALHAAGDVPPALRGAAKMLTDSVARAWDEPDHGIWEIRGAPQRYTHSRVMAWSALRDAAALVSAGVMDGEASAWSAAKTAIHEAVLAPGVTMLQLHDHGGGADAALSLVPLLGFLAADDPRSLATLRLIDAQLDRDGLLDRHGPSADALAEPCAPFIFPTFWMASALRRCGEDGSRHLRAAMAARGSLGLFGEVADPRDRSPLGNYPQVQSHASCVLTLTSW